MRTSGGKSRTDLVVVCLGPRVLRPRRLGPMTGRAVGHQDQANANAIRPQSLAQSRSLAAASGDPPRRLPQLSMLGMGGNVATRKVAGDHDRRGQLRVTWLRLEQGWHHNIAPEARERNRPGGFELPGLTWTHDDELNRTRTR